jgi:hypothetical protein
MAKSIIVDAKTDVMENAGGVYLELCRVVDAERSISPFRGLN